jgi:hypothetical protein
MKAFKNVKNVFAVALIALALNIPVMARPVTSPFKVVAFYTDYNSMGDGGHRSFSREANTWFPTVAAANGFTYTSTTNWGNLNASYLANYQVVMFFDNLPGDGNQRTALQNYVTNGGGWLGFHVCAFNQNPSAWSWYFSQFLAMGSFISNTWPPSAPLLLVEDTTHPAMKGLGATFKPADNEWYRWGNDLRTNQNIKILCSIDKSAYPVGTQGVFTWSGAGYVPVVWTNKNYKMLYMNMGHNRADDVGLSTTFTNASMAKLVLNTLKWLGGATTAIGSDGPVSPKATSAHSGITIKTDANFVSVSSGNPGKAFVTLSDAGGRTIVKTVAGNGICRIDRSSITSGVYVVRIADSHGTETRTVCLE